MNEYIQLEFTGMSLEQSDILLARLTAAGFDGFEENENSLKAFITAGNFDESVVLGLQAAFPFVYTKTIIEETNWNQVWESNFQPVIIADFVAIRAHFHEPIAGVEHEIVITPKMSFGTGHHATTSMMIRQMRAIDFTGKTVLDFGTGTGILSILAEKMGAAAVTAIDNDEWSIINATENLERNASVKIKVEKAGDAAGDKQYDIILANINKNVILENLSSLANQLSPGGLLLISGLLLNDEADIMNKTGKVLLKPGKKMLDNNWISLVFKR